MAFDAAGLTKISTGSANNTSGGTAGLWMYTSEDNQAAIEADAYFDTAGLVAGDVIIIACDLDATPVFLHKGVSVGGTDVTVIDILST